MKFSILIAHYNNGVFLKKCFDSILEQTYKNWEVIIVDDCSAESEKKILKELIAGDSRFLLFENEINKGTGYTKKRCADLATGDICGFLDPDDALTPDALEESIKIYTDKSIVATYSQFYVCDGNLSIEKLFPYSREIKNGDSYFFNIYFDIAHFFTFKKETYDATEKINENISSSVDQDLYLKLYEKGNFSFIKKPLYLYRIHQKGISQDKKKKEKLHKNWHQVLLDTLERRQIKTLYKKDVRDIDNLPNFIFEKQNTLIKRIIRKIT